MSDVETILSLMSRTGFDFNTVKKLRKIAKTLHRWDEACCNGDIVRAENDKPFLYYPMSAGMVPYRDYERGALQRLRSILQHSPFTFYRQTDPRGCSIYLIKRDLLHSGTRLDSVYSSIGIAIY